MEEEAKEWGSGKGWAFKYYDWSYGFLMFFE